MPLAAPKAMIVDAILREVYAGQPPSAPENKSLQPTDPLKAAERRHAADGRLAAAADSDRRTELAGGGTALKEVVPDAEI